MTEHDYIMQRLSSRHYEERLYAIRARICDTPHDWELSYFTPGSDSRITGAFTGTIQQVKEHLLEITAALFPADALVKVDNWGEFYDLIGLVKHEDDSHPAITWWREINYATLGSGPDKDEWTTLRHESREAYHQETLRYNRTAWLRWIKRHLQRKGK